MMDQRNGNRENLGELPKGWVWTTLGGLIEPSREKVDPLKLPESVYVGLEHIESGTGKLLGHGHAKEVRSTKTKFYRGDMIYGKLRPYLNKVHVPDFEGVCSTDILVFPKSPYLDNKYLLFRMLRDDFVRYANINVSGVQHPRVDFKTLSRFDIPLPPLGEQHRIVTKIEELFSDLDAGVAALQKTKSQLKRYRQAVLKAAVEGKLTAEWRAAKAGKIEPASALLERIRAERAKNAGGKSVGAIHELPQPDAAELGQLPEGWEWSNIGDITDLSAGMAFKKSEYSLEGVRLFQIANVSFGKIIWDEVVYVPENYIQKYPQLVLRTGDILIALNRPLLNGELKVGQLKEKDVPAILYQRVGRFDFYQPSIKSYFLYFVRSPLFVDRFKRLLQGIEIPFVNKPRLLNLPIPIPPLIEQAQIVAEVERRLSVADEIERTVDASLKQAERLRQSILKRAFAGKLVPQDPSDEPAEKLLERIKGLRIADDTQLSGSTRSNRKNASPP